MKWSSLLLLAIALAGCVTPRPIAPLSCAATPADEAALRQAVTGFYAALKAGDTEAYARATSSSFYAYEVGKRYTGQQLFDVIAEAHRAGQVYQWNVGSMVTRVDCHSATAIWETTGSSGVPPKTSPRAWLESAIFVRERGTWVMAFLHSTPKNPKP